MTHNRIGEPAPGSDRPLVPRKELGANVLEQGTAGQSAVLTTAVAGTPGPWVTLLDVQGDPRLAEALSLLVGVPTQVDGTPLAGAGFDLDVELRVSYGVHGVLFEVRLDAMNGGRYVLAASRLRVDARITGASGGVVAGTQARVGAAVGYGSSGSSVGQRTLRTGAVNAGASADLPIPAFSKGVSVVVNINDPANGFTALLLDAAGVAVGSFNFPVSSVASTGPGPLGFNDGTGMLGSGRAGISIPNTARTLRLTNGGGAAAKTFAAVFELAL